MTLLPLLAGVAVVVLIFYDAYVTTVSATSAGGPLTHRLGVGLWRGLRRLARSPRSRVLSAAGPVIVFAMLLTWLTGLWLGWTLVFSSDSSAVVHDATGESADLWSRAYFAGFVVYTLGVGDYTPQGAPWQVLAVAATISGFVLLTMTVSYLIPVMMAVSDRRQQGMLLHSLGENAQELLVTAWDGRDFAPLQGHLRDLAAAVPRLTQQYLSYPVLHFFHSPSHRAAFEPGLARADEALLILEEGVAAEARPHPAVLQPLRRSLARFSELAIPPFVPVSRDPPPFPDLDALEARGIPTRPREQFHAAVEARGAHRARLSAMVADARWSWSDVEAPAHHGEPPSPPPPPTQR